MFSNKGEPEQDSENLGGKYFENEMMSKVVEIVRNKNNEGVRFELVDEEDDKN